MCPSFRCLASSQIYSVQFVGSNLCRQGTVCKSAMEDDHFARIPIRGKELVALFAFSVDDKRRLFS